MYKRQAGAGAPEPRGPSRGSPLLPSTCKKSRRRCSESAPKDDAHNLLIIVDTSASMSDDDLQDALGAIRATAAALQINSLRLFAYDAQVRDYG